MKKISVAGLIIAGVVATSSISAFGCSKDVAFADYQNALTGFSEKIKGSELIDSKNINFKSSDSYQGYAPAYTPYIQDKINNFSTELNDFNKVAEFYDFVLAYCLDSIDFSSIILLSSSKKTMQFEDQQKINTLYSSIGQIETKLTEQENRIDSVNKYINGLKSKDENLEKSALYKYEQGYSEFIRYILDIAIANIQVVDNSFVHIDYMSKDNTKAITENDVKIYEKTLFIQNNLQIIDCYFKYINEEFKSNTPSTNPNNAGITKIASNYNQICNNYDEFLTSVVKKTNDNAFEKALTDTDFAKIQNSKTVFNQEIDIMGNCLNQIDIYSLAYDYMGDFNSITPIQQNYYDKINDFYKNVMPRWENSFLAYFDVGE